MWRKIYKDSLQEGKEIKERKDLEKESKLEEVGKTKSMKKRLQTEEPTT